MRPEPCGTSIAAPGFMSELLRLLRESRIASAAELEIASVAAHCFGGTPAEHLVAAGLARSQAVAAAVGNRMKLPCARADELAHVDGGALARIGHDTACELRALPLGVDDGHVVVAMEDPAEPRVECELRFFAGAPLMRRVAGPLAMSRALAAHCGHRPATRPTADEVAYALVGFALRRAREAVLLWCDADGLRVAHGTRPRREPIQAGLGPLVGHLLERPRAARSPRLAQSDRQLFSTVFGGPSPDLVAVSVPDTQRVVALLCASRVFAPFTDEDLRGVVSYASHALPAATASQARAA